MSTRPFKIVIKNGQHVREDLTDEEIADAQRRTAEEQADQQARQIASDREAAIKAFVENLFDNQQALKRTTPPPQGG